MKVGKRKRQCEGKRVFETMEAAEKAAHVPWKMLAKWGYMTAYRCTTCKKYHYGHKSK